MALLRAPAARKFKMEKQTFLKGWVEECYLGRSSSLVLRIIFHSFRKWMTDF
jgi:hypothetical protein